MAGFPIGPPSSNPPMDPNVRRQMMMAAMLGSVPSPMAPQASPMLANSFPEPPAVPGGMGGPAASQMVAMSAMQKVEQALTEALPAFEQSFPGAIPLLQIMARAGSDIMKVVQGGSGGPSAPDMAPDMAGPGAG